MLVEQLNQRFYHVADFGVDVVGGNQIGVRLKLRKPQASALDASIACAMMPQIAPNAHKPGGLRVCLQMTAVVQDILNICTGLVLDVLDLQSPK